MGASGDRTEVPPPYENGLESQHSRCANRFNRDQSAETSNFRLSRRTLCEAPKVPPSERRRKPDLREESQSSEEIGAGKEESWAGEKGRTSEEGQVSEESWAGEKSRASEEDRFSEESRTSEEEGWASKEGGIAGSGASQSWLHWRMLLPARCTACRAEEAG